MVELGEIAQGKGNFEWSRMDIARVKVVEMYSSSKGLSVFRFKGVEVYSRREESHNKSCRSMSPSTDVTIKDFEGCLKLETHLWSKVVEVWLKVFSCHCRATSSIFLMTDRNCQFQNCTQLSLFPDSSSQPLPPSLVMQVLCIYRCEDPTFMSSPLKCHHRLSGEIP